jgi:D-alanyl-D-alanine carboxypeptidase/D-alanyl-D-alanine-endopeptidase (penicillin-binding protein 4)
MFRARAASTRPSSGTDEFRSLALLLLIGLSGCHATPRPVAVAVPPGLTGAARLQADIQRILAAPDLDRSYWGIVIRSLKTGEPLFALNGGRLLMPGSTMKILTLATAAERLGWDYTFDTKVLALGSVDGETLHGDLLVAGAGDPSLMEAEGARLFAALVDALRTQGVRAISGRIVGDDNVFDDEALGPGWAWDDLADRDAVPVTGLQYNENTVQATVTAAEAAGLPAGISVAPDGSGLYVNNHVVTGGADEPASLSAFRWPGSSLLELRGSIPLGSAPLARTVSVDNPTLFFATAMRERLLAAGIEVSGPAVDIDDLVDPPAPDEGSAVLAAHRSLPLSALAVRLMKNSQNLYAETLLKTLGASAGTPTFESGRAVAAETLGAWGAAPASVVQVDGSGLSRYNYLTADALVAVLTHVAREERLRGPFEASLPVAGRDGTLAARMRGTAAEGNARAKSGTLANVRSLAGYVTGADGEPLVFAIVANNFGTMPEVAIAAIDAIVVRLAEFRR